MNSFYALGLRFSLLSAIGACFASAEAWAVEENCYALYHNISYQAVRGADTPYFLKAAGTDAPIAKAFEMEGREYSEIVEWFPNIKEPEATAYMQNKLAAEAAGKQSPVLTRWLNDYPSKHRAKGVSVPSNWKTWSPEQRLAHLTSQPDYWSLISQKGKDDLFWDGGLNFSVMKVGPEAPPFLTIVDDLGSWEIMTKSATPDIAHYEKARKIVEDRMGGSVGHQNFFALWPKDAGLRKKIGPEVIEMLDAGTWFLYWRQMNRNPADVTSIIEHQYLGVYTRDSLNRLHKSFVDNDPARFKDKYRMIGARSFRANDAVDWQAGEKFVPALEMRSGNKGVKRGMMENMMQARLSSGDYHGLLKYNEYEFNPSAPIRELTSAHLKPKQIEVLEAFEKDFPAFRWSGHGNADNHFRNKIAAPLLPWENRLDIGYKMDVYKAAQGEYAKRLHDISEKYLKSLKKVEEKKLTLRGLREDTLEEIEKAAYVFAHRTRLDKDFERYLKPRPTDLPQVTVASKGPIDVNQVPLGVEYSFRFPDRVRGAKNADEHLKRMAESMKEKMGGGTVVKQDVKGAHGHGIGIRYLYTDPQNRTWRVEWDGIKRSYNDSGKPVRARGGHVEVPSPKFVPQTTDEVVGLYEAARSSGVEAKRYAGGGHMNISLENIKALPPKQGARMAANFIAYMESNREMISFLWQHPFRVRAAAPVKQQPSLGTRLSAFDGDWDDLGKLLYDERYFNTGVGRKPSYTQLNATALLGDAVPEQFRKTIDIRKPGQEWYPAFGGKGLDRQEMRLFDAPSDEYMAALQIKYTRALLNRTWNSPKPLEMKPLFDSSSRTTWLEDPAKFLDDAEQHLKDLGLDPEEFRPLLVESMEVQRAESKFVREIPAVYPDFES